jgi:rhodanese-related sulfurtransferase
MHDMTLTPVSPEQARALIERGVRLIDIREPDEHARERIAVADNLPLSRLDRVDPGGADAVIYHCRSGNRTAANATRLARAADCPAYVLDGGLDAWRRAGLPVAVDKRQPLELMRQVQLAAGALVLLGVVLGFLAAPAFFGLSAFVGAGLMMAGATGWCGMARLLSYMPWNRRATAA